MASAQDTTTLLHNEEESFALAPVDASAIKGFTRAKRYMSALLLQSKDIHFVFLQIIIDIHFIFYKLYKCINENL